MNTAAASFVAAANTKTYQKILEIRNEICVQIDFARILEVVEWEPAAELAGPKKVA